MTTLDDLFREFLGTIQPDEVAVERAVAAHKDLRTDLEADKAYGPYVARTLLSGSYGRDTAIKSIKDVDILIQTTYTREYLETNKHGSETAQEYLLRLTREAVTRTGRVVKPMTRRRSILVHLPKEINDIGKTLPELTLDIVPLLIPLDKDIDPMTIADRELSEWCDTYPITQLQASCNRNDRSYWIGDRHLYKPLVKMFKAWKLAHFGSSKTPKGFVLECLAARYHNPQSQHWGEAVRDFFQNLCDEWPEPESLTEIPTVPDVSDTSPVEIAIAKELTGAKKTLKRIHYDLTLIEEAITQAETDLYKAATILRRVFGQDCDIVCFPLPDDEKTSGQRSSSFIRGSQRDIREAPEFG